MYFFYSKYNTEKEKGMKYSEYLDRWLEEIVRPNAKQRTYVRYESICRRHICPGLGDLEISELTTELVQDFVRELSREFASNTVRAICCVVKSSLSKAERLGIAPVNIQYLVLPKIHEKLVESFSASEQRKIVHFVMTSGKRKNVGILVAMYTGLRIGELLALEWRDIDFANAQLIVKKSCHDAWVGGKYQKMIESPKTSMSNRVIPLPRQIMPILRAAKRMSMSRYVVSGPEGRDISVRSYQMTFSLLLRKLHIPHRGFHSLRHTFATRALECGMDARTLAEIMGHANPSITLRRYAHSMIEHKRAMMNEVGKNIIGTQGRLF